MITYRFLYEVQLNSGRVYCTALRGSIERSFAEDYHTKIVSGNSTIYAFSMNSWLYQVWFLDYNILEVMYLNKFLQHIQNPIYIMFGDLFSFFLKTYLHNDFMFEDMFTHFLKTCGHYIFIPVYTMFEEVFAKTSISKLNTQESWFLCLDGH